MVCVLLWHGYFFHETKNKEECRSYFFLFKMKVGSKFIRHSGTKLLGTCFSVALWQYKFLLDFLEKTFEN